MKLVTGGGVALAAFTAFTVGLLAGCTSTPIPSATSTNDAPAVVAKAAPEGDCITVDLAHADRAATVAHRDTSFKILADGWTTRVWPGVPAEVCGVMPGSFTLGLTEDGVHASLDGNPAIIHVAAGETHLAYRQVEGSQISVASHYDAESKTLNVVVLGPQG